MIIITQNINQDINNRDIKPNTPAVLFTKITAKKKETLNQYLHFCLNTKFADYLIFFSNKPKNKIYLK